MNEVQIKEIVRGIIREEFKQSLSEARGIPKLFLKIEAVKKEIDRLTAERKSKFGGEYARKLNAETDPKKREQLKQPILAISKKISAYQKNLADLYDMEEKYIQNLDKDADYNDVSDYTDTLHLESVNEATLQKGKTYGGSKCEGGCFVGKTGLMKIIKISKENPKDVFMFREDNFSGLQPHFVKNGVIAKATVINPAYDFEKHKVNSLKIGNDVILSVRLFVSTNESVSEGKKAFKVNPGIGKSKYSISSHDGHKKHNDGSDFWDIQIYKNKVDLEKGIKDYKSKGFVEESINELKLIPKGNGIPGNFFKIKAKYNTFAEYEPHAKIGDTILKYSKKSPSMRAWLATGNLDDRAKQYLSKVHSIGTDGVNLTLFGKQTPASVHPSDKKELAVVVLQN